MGRRRGGIPAPAPGLLPLALLAGVILTFTQPLHASTQGSCTPLLFKVWGAGGGAGQYPGVYAVGGAGGFVSGVVCADPGERFWLAVGEAGSMSPGSGRPNGGVAFLYYREGSGTGNGGGASWVAAANGTVLIGAGGGGGSYGGGGGGGTCGGQVGQGGNYGETGTLGGGGGGSPDSSARAGSCGGGAGSVGPEDGVDGNGAGGAKTALNAAGPGGGGGSSFWLARVSNMTVINASSNAAVGRAHLPPSHSFFAPGLAGQHAGQRSNDGGIIVQDPATGAVLAGYFSYGFYEFVAPAAPKESPSPVSASKRELLQKATDCFGAGRSFNASQGLCIPRMAASAVPSAAAAGFIGLSSDGALVLAPPAAQSIIRVHGRIREIDELRDEIVALLRQLQALEA